MEPSVTSTTLLAQTITKELSYTCNCFFTPSPCTIQFGLAPVERSGGHDHHSATRPLGELSSNVIQYDGVNPATMTYTAPEVSGDVLLNGHANIDACGSDSKSFLIRMKVDGLSSLGASANYTLIGAYGEPGVSSQHTSNHGVTASMRDFVNRVAAAYKNALPNSNSLRLNDASLAWGGLFDIYNNWNRPHASHRFGTDIDIDDLTPTELKKLVSIVQREGGGKAAFFKEGNHYHVRIPR